MREKPYIERRRAKLSKGEKRAPRNVRSNLRANQHK